MAGVSGSQLRAPSAAKVDCVDIASVGTTVTEESVVSVQPQRRLSMRKS